MIDNINWYKSWFNSPFYPILYQNRDSRDARELIDNLIPSLDVGEETRFLDLACGRGRHAIYLNSKGYDVTGLDMSKSSVLEASQHINMNLRFLVGDMRNIPFENHFDIVMNLFTSFGYFEDAIDNLITLKSVYQSLKPNGVFILDFFNTPRVLKEMIEEEKKVIQGVEFHIARTYVDGKIRKQIEFEHNDSDYYFEERVEALHLADFKELFEQAGFKIKATYGDYNLNPYNPETSERIIVIGTK